MARHKMKTPQEIAASQKFVRRKKLAETLASIGMILIAMTMLVTLVNLDNRAIIDICKYVFAVGVLVFTGARTINVSPEGESIKLRRIRRMEFWSGVCFLVAAFFWFYNETKSVSADNLAVTVSLLRDTIVFTIAGAVIQVIASWFIYYREKKELAEKKG